MNELKVSGMSNWIDQKEVFFKIEIMMAGLDYSQPLSPTLSS